MKELLLLILIYTVRTGQGITSDELTEILWNGKSAKDAKNNRSVNLAKLKSILEKIGNCSLNKKSVYWQFQFNEGQFFLDYEQFVHLTKAHTFVDRPLMTSLLKVIESGAFLAKTEYDWLDDIKAEVSNAVIDISLAYLKQESEDPEFVIRVANAIFFFDRLNEEALEFKCKSLVLLRRYSLANNTYEKFIKDYRDIYGEEFYKSFNDVIKA
jgi:two-component SAPR family response regulator